MPVPWLAVLVMLMQSTPRADAVSAADSLILREIADSVKAGENPPSSGAVTRE